MKRTTLAVFAPTVLLALGIVLAQLRPDLHAALCGTVV